MPAWLLRHAPLTHAYLVTGAPFPLTAPDFPPEEPPPETSATWSTAGPYPFAGRASRPSAAATASTASPQPEHWRQDPVMQEEHARTLDRLVQARLEGQYKERCCARESLKKQAEYHDTWLGQIDGAARGLGWALMQKLGCGVVEADDSEQWGCCGRPGQCSRPIPLEECGDCQRAPRGRYRYAEDPYDFSLIPLPVDYGSVRRRRRPQARTGSAPPDPACTPSRASRGSMEGTSKNPSPRPHREVAGPRLGPRNELGPLQNRDSEPSSPAATRGMEPPRAPGGGPRRPGSSEQPPLRPGADPRAAAMRSAVPPGFVHHAPQAPGGRPPPTPSELSWESSHMRGGMAPPLPSEPSVSSRHMVGGSLPPHSSSASTHGSPPLPVAAAGAAHLEFPGPCLPHGPSGSAVAHGPPPFPAAYAGVPAGAEFPGRLPPTPSNVSRESSHLSGGHPRGLLGPGIARRAPDAREAAALAAAMRLHPGGSRPHSPASASTSRRAPAHGVPEAPGSAAEGAGPPPPQWPGHAGLAATQRQLPETLGDVARGPSPPQGPGPGRPPASQRQPPETPGAAVRGRSPLQGPGPGGPSVAPRQLPVTVGAAARGLSPPQGPVPAGPPAAPRLVPETPGAVARGPSPPQGPVPAGPAAAPRQRSETPGVAARGAAGSRSPRPTDTVAAAPASCRAPSAGQGMPAGTQGAALPREAGGPAVAGASGSRLRAESDTSRRPAQEARPGPRDVWRAPGVPQISGPNSCVTVL